MVKIATTALHVEHDKKKNLEKYFHYIDEAAAQKVDLILFPELSLQGFAESMTTLNVRDALYANASAELVPEGESTQALIEKAKACNMYIAWGMYEKDEAKADIIYNTAVLVGPEGYVGKYRKVHQPMTDMIYYTSGTEYPVFETRLGRIGMMICFDKTYPEVARILAVKGADLILCPTCWPLGGKHEEDDDQLTLLKTFANARAWENEVFIVTANHVGVYAAGGEECGHSRITGPFVNDVKADTLWDEGMVSAEIDLKQDIIRARNSAMGVNNLLKYRHPDTYGEILEKYI